MTKRAKKSASTAKNKRKPQPSKYESPGKIIPASDVSGWRQAMGLSERDAAMKLGMSRGFLRSCEEEGAPYYIGLAMAAYAKGLSPYSAKEEEEEAMLAIEEEAARRRREL